MKAGSDGLLIEAARQLLVSYYPKQSRIFLNWSKDDFRCFATALADDLASRPGTKQYVAHWITDECNTLAAKSEIADKDRNLSKLEQFNGEVNEVDDVVWLNRIASYTNNIKCNEQYKKSFHLLDRSIIILRVHNALDQHIF